MDLMDISPDKQNIDRVFSNTPYYIDFYQRDYRWTDEPVLRLLDDIFYKFKAQYARSCELDPGKETITAYYPWYYLNTYVTNVIDGRLYVVDGQQRLTTLSLILIKLRHLAMSHKSKLAGWIDSKIAGRSGFEQEFWMNHVGHRATQQALFEYSEKLKSYANTLYWNETLRADSYKSKLDMNALKDQLGLELEPLDQFGPDQLEARHKLLFKLVEIIWS